MSSRKINAIVIDSDNVEHNIQISEGLTLAEGIKNHGLDLECACGGALACSTCHVILEQDWHTLLSAPTEEEQDMLDLAFGLRQTSRLGCQIIISSDHEKIKCKLPSASRNIVSHN